MLSYHYVAYLSELKEETLSMLSEDEIESLRKDLSEIRILGYVEFFRENIELIRELARMTLSQRLKRKKWQTTPKDKRILILALYHYYELSEAFLREVYDNSIDSGGSYRTVADLGGISGFQLLGNIPFRWPFDGKDPIPGGKIKIVD